MSNSIIDRNFLRKTSMCKNGTNCTFHHCTFAHCKNDQNYSRMKFINKYKNLVEIPSKFWKKTKYCNYKENCEYGRNCDFAHTSSELSNSIEKLFNFIYSKLQKNSNEDRESKSQTKKIYFKFKDVENLNYNNESSTFYIQKSGLRLSKTSDKITAKMLGLSPDRFEYFLFLRALLVHEKLSNFKGEQIECKHGCDCFWYKFGEKYCNYLHKSVDKESDADIDADSDTDTVSDGNLKRDDNAEEIEGNILPVNYEDTGRLFLRFPMRDEVILNDD
jgi:hypothetical protein